MKTQTALNCPCCAHVISDRAYRCPQCGHPLKSVSWKIFGTLAAIAFVVVAVWFLMHTFNASQDAINGPIRFAPPSR